MAKKSHIKVRLVPEASPDSAFFYYTRKKLLQKKNSVENILIFFLKL